MLNVICYMWYVLCFMLHVLMSYVLCAPPTSWQSSGEVAMVFAPQSSPQVPVSLQASSCAREALTRMHRAAARMLRRDLMLFHFGTAIHGLVAGLFILRPDSRHTDNSRTHCLIFGEMDLK